MSVGRTHLNIGNKSRCSLKNKKLGCKLKLNTFRYKRENNIDQVFMYNTLWWEKNNSHTVSQGAWSENLPRNWRINLHLENHMCLLATEDKRECVSQLDLAGDE